MISFAPCSFTIAAHTSIGIRIITSVLSPQSSVLDQSSAYTNEITIYLLKCMVHTVV